MDRRIGWVILGAVLCFSCGDLFPFNDDPPKPEDPWKGPPHLFDTVAPEDSGQPDWHPFDLEILADQSHPDADTFIEVLPQDTAYPDLPPCFCSQNEDCPPTGSEPCTEAICVLDLDGCGECQVVQALQCYNPDPCWYSLCDPDAGGCVDARHPDGTLCDDFDPCTQGDLCTEGVCQGTPLLCDDDNPCTVDMCSAESDGCLFLAANVPCDDGNPCTENDQCSDAVCAPGTPVKCDDGDPCTKDYCNPAVGCTHVPVTGCCHNDSECEDANLCTTDQCNNYSCYHKLTFCDDSDACTEDLCDPDLGCYANPVLGCCNEDNECDDSDLCTTDWCMGHSCQHGAVFCDDGDVCTADSCAAQTGCTTTPIPGCCHEDDHCDDGNLCTGESCIDHQCLSIPISCNDNDICTSDSCLPQSGCTFLAVPGCCHTVSDCDDQNLCTSQTCTGNVCQYSDVICIDGDACTVDGCQPDSGCNFVPIPDPGCCNVDADCEDFDPCTSEACIAYSCVYTAVGGPDCCAPDCGGKQCGPDGCGGICGNCPLGFFCKEDDFQCHEECFPDCAGKECGPDGCGTYCGHCNDNEKCNILGQCVMCQPFCWGKQCGSDGCGGSCGICPPGFACESDIGQCTAGCACEGADCYSEGFEHGTLKDWSFEGDAEVTHNMGSTEAPEGFWMAVVGNGLSELEVGWLKKTFCPAADTSVLTLKWKFYSEEFKEWCGSEFQDSLVILLQKENESLEVLHLTVDDLCPAAQCPNCGSNYVGLEDADVDFDQNDVWATPWQELTFAVPPGFAAEPFTIAVPVTDVGDMIYTSAVLIDDIHFQ